MGHHLSINTIKQMLESDDRTKDLSFSDERLHKLAYHFDSYHDDNVREEFGTTMVMCLYVPEYKPGLQKAYKQATEQMIKIAQFLWIDEHRVLLPRKATWLEKYEISNTARKLHASDAEDVRNMFLELTDIKIDDFVEDIYPF